MGLVEQIYNRAKLKYGEGAGSSFPAKLLQDELRVSGELSPDGYSG
jgi:hypothetical protein